MNVLVTGGAGYIGSHTCKALALAGHLPITYDNLSMGQPNSVKWGPLEIGDISDKLRLDQVLRYYEIDAVIHFAALAYVGESMCLPSKYFLNNVAGTTVLLDAIMHAGIDKFVFSSTCATYGIPSTLPIDESMVPNPVNPYGLSKLNIEHQLKWLGHLTNLRWIALRYFNAAGADPAGDIGEIHKPETHLIPLALKAAAPGDYYLSIYGDDYPTPDGTAIRDYVHVQDLANAHLKALHALLRSNVNDVINVGTGLGVSVKQILEVVYSIVGSKPRYLVTTKRDGDPPELVADPSKAWDVLNWKANQSSIDQIVRDAWNWHKMDYIL